MTVYDRLAATTLRLLQTYGAPATLKASTAGAYDPATGSASVTIVATAVSAVVFDYPAKLIDGTLIKTGDKQALIAASGAPAPLVNHTLTWQGKDYMIVSVKTTSPAGQPVIHEAQIRA